MAYGNQTGVKSLDLVASDPRVLAIEKDSEGDGPGRSRSFYTVTLARGYSISEVHYPSADSVRNVRALIKMIQPCHCPDCTND